MFHSMITLFLLIGTLSSYPHDVSACTTCPVRINNRVIDIGMTEEAVRGVAGRPHRIVEYVNPYGVVTEREFIYALGKKSIIMRFDERRVLKYIRDCIGLESRRCQ